MRLGPGNAPLSESGLLMRVGTSDHKNDRVSQSFPYRMSKATINDSMMMPAFHALFPWLQQKQSSEKIMEPSVPHGLQGPQGSTTHSVLSHCISHSYPWKCGTTHLRAREGRRPGMEVIRYQ